MQDFEWIVVVIPVVSALVGWITNVVAVKMMFSPIEFVGLPPYLGWQGIVPANAKDFAGKAAQLITGKLVNLQTALSSFNSQDFASGHLGSAIDSQTEEILGEFDARMTAAGNPPLADQPKAVIRKLLRKEISDISTQLLDEVSADVDSYIDSVQIVMDAAEKDKELIGQIFQEVGDSEFEFVRRSGGYFGLLFGIIQMVAWLLFPIWWVLPLFGFFVGYVTNWLALKLIFEPAKPTKVGPWILQGLFHKRQQEVSVKFATLISGEILNPETMVQHIMDGPGGKKIMDSLTVKIGNLLAKYRENPMFSMAIPANEWSVIEQETIARVREEIPKPGGILYAFTAGAFDIFKNLSESMAQLDSETFESVLRPSFQQDEWKLILAGGMLGLGAGVLQVVFLFGQQLG